MYPLLYPIIDTNDSVLYVHASHHISISSIYMLVILTVSMVSYTVMHGCSHMEDAALHGTV